MTPEFHIGLAARDICKESYEDFSLSLTAADGSANAPEQEDPDPAVQPKQWVPVMMDRRISRSNLIPFR